jgi:hypothetical protein
MDEDSNKLVSQGLSTSTTPKDDDNDNENVLNVEHSTVPNIALPISTNASLSSYTISLYVLRQADLNETWTIQAIFDNDNKMKYIFKAVGPLADPKVSLVDVVDLKHSQFCLE